MKHKYITDNVPQYSIMQQDSDPVVCITANIRGYAYDVAFHVQRESAENLIKDMDRMTQALIHAINAAGDDADELNQEIYEKFFDGKINGWHWG